MSKRKKSRRQAKRKTSRAMPLRMSEHRLQAPRQKRSKRNDYDSIGNRDGNGGVPLSGMWLSVFLRQQALWASGMANLMRMQSQLGRTWLSQPR
jgi:hypothetical protein